MTMIEKIALVIIAGLLVLLFTMVTSTIEEVEAQKEIQEISREITIN